MSRLGAFVAALAFVAAGCAPPVVGGVWHTGAVSAFGLSAQDIAVEFVDGSNVRATIDRGGAQQCPERYQQTASGTWFVNANNEIIVNVQCAREVPHCDQSGGIMRTFDICGLFGVLRPGRFVQRAPDVFGSLEMPSISLRR